MPKARLRRESKPVTREELNEALRYTTREIMLQMNAQMENFGRGLRQEMREGFERVELKFDGALELFVTRTEVHGAFKRLSNVLRPHGINIDPESLLKP